VKMNADHGNIITWFMGWSCGG